MTRKKHVAAPGHSRLSDAALPHVVAGVCPQLTIAGAGFLNINIV